MNKLILNRIAIWQPKNNDSFTMRASAPGRLYFENGVAKTSETAMFRYAKNYKLGKGKDTVKFCLFVLTFSDSAENIEFFLDKTAKKIDIGYAQKILATSSLANFEYTDEYYEGVK